MKIEIYFKYYLWKNRFALGKVKHNYPFKD